MTKEEWIQAYFEGRFTSEQQETFETLLEKDPEMKEAFLFEKQVQTVLQREERKALKERLEALSTAAEQENSGSRTRYYWVVAAASIAAIIVLTFTVFLRQEQISNEALYARYFSPYENVVQPIQRGEAIESLEQQAFEAYELQNYQQADSLFTEVQKRKSDPYLNFYKGISLMQLQEYQEAAFAIEGYLQQDGQLKVRAQWYLALCYLQLDQLEKSKRLLREVLATQSFKSEQAEELLDLLP
ncbi:tetratricopeptide repeat protein [Croceiramulus getboli]|nr:hypothetical protein P8624_08850 [Flavobacteriaceae bacterium YJPT1-3]